MYAQKIIIQHWQELALYRDSDRIACREIVTRAARQRGCTRAATFALLPRLPRRLLGGVGGEVQRPYIIGPARYI